MSLGVEKEESVLILTGDAKIGFVAGGGVAEGGFVAEVEGVAVISGGLGVIEDGLVAKGYVEDAPQDLGGLAAERAKEMWKASTRPNTLEERCRRVRSTVGRSGAAGASWAGWKWYSRY